MLSPISPPPFITLTEARAIFLSRPSVTCPLCSRTLDIRPIQLISKCLRAKLATGLLSTHQHCSQPWSEKLLFAWAKINGEMHNWSEMMRMWNWEFSLKEDISIDALLKRSGTIIEEEAQRILGKGWGRLLNWLLHSWTLRCCGYLHKIKLAKILALMAKMIF